MLRTSLIALLLASVAVPALAENVRTQRREVRQDKKELREDKRETRDDKRDVARFADLLQELEDVRRTKALEKIAGIDRRVLAALADELDESHGEARRDGREVGRDRRELRRDVTEDRREVRDDRRDRRDDRRDAKAERKELSRTAALRSDYKALTGRTDPKSIGKRHGILKQLVAMERKEVRQDKKEIREDKRELREDRRDRREERRDRRR